MIWVFVILAFSTLSAGCEGKVESVLGTPVAQIRAKAKTPETTSVFPPEEPKPCVELEAGIVACHDGEALRAWATEHHTPEPDETTLRTALDPPDPVPIRDGLVVYDEMLRGVARQTRSHLELWANTPTYNDTELQAFNADPALWRAVAEFRAGSSNEQIRRLREALRAKNRARLRAMLLRDGVFYLEDPAAAAYAAKYVGLRQIFDDEQLELHRAGQRYLLRRDDRGSYLHFDPVLDESVATLHMLDRVGPPGSLPPLLGYRLQELRRAHGLSNIIAGEEAEGGRAAVVRFFDGEQFDGALVLGPDGQSRLAIAGDPANLVAVRERNVREREVICSLLEVTDLMVRERLEFDEPKVEYGQQDGRLRPRFERAYEQGRATYQMNGVTYRVFDKNNRPMVPQLCIDFVTDAVQRMQGDWWQPSAAPTAPERPEFDIRDYLPFRTVRSLVELGRANPQVAHVESLSSDELIPYERKADFFENLWRRRDTVREGDVIVIYGLRADNRNHFHSFYVRETDPIYGVPVVLTANPGFARIQAWQDVMWESPKRSIRHFVRWNTDWLRAPRAVDTAVLVTRQATAIVGTIAATQ